MAHGQKSSYHPLVQHTAEEQQFLWLRLLRSRRVGAATFHRLVEEYQSAANALEALPEIAAEAGVQNYEVCPEPVVAKEIAAARKIGAIAIWHGSALYPRALYDLHDAPPLLWARGRIELLQAAKIALIGARNASSLGTRMAAGLAKSLGKEGWVITSGFARGIDTAAHRSSLETGTIAVFAGGVDHIYPSENTKLAEEVLASGLFLSEQPIGLTPRARHFPARNRIISGLSQAVVVVEAASKSGSLITAQNALDQGREVMAVPGHPIDSRASGCNQLIRDGAQLVRSASDIIEALSPPAQPELPLDETHTNTRPARSLRDTAKLHQDILNRLGPSPLAEDQLISDLKLSVHQVTPVLTDLELNGEIIRNSGGVLTKR